MKKTLIEKLSLHLREQNIQVTCLTSTANIFYLTGFYCEPHERLLALLVFPDEEPILICPAMEMNMAKQAGWAGNIAGYTDTDNPWQILGSELMNNNHSYDQIAVEIDHLTVSRLRELEALLPGTKISGIDHFLLEMRVVKTDTEIEIIRKAAKLADIGIAAGVDALREGISEIEVLSSIEAALKENGVRKMPFDPVVLFGKKSADPHGVPGNSKLKPGDFVLFDIGAVYEGYCSDITRTFIFGKASEEQIKIYETVLKAEEGAIGECKPGNKISNLDKAARQIIDDNGYGKFFIHRTGHGIGIEVHEFPSIDGENKEIIKAGMAITIEPGIYVPEIGGVRIEDDVVITEEGPEILTKYPKKLQIID